MSLVKENTRRFLSSSFSLGSPSPFSSSLTPVFNTSFASKEDSTPLCMARRDTSYSPLPMLKLTSSFFSLPDKGRPADRDRIVSTSE